MALNWSRATATGAVVDVSALDRISVQVDHIILTGDSAAAKAIIREGGGSGAVLLTITAAINTTIPVEYCRIFQDDVHVTLSGTGAEIVVGWK